MVVAVSHHLKTYLPCPYPRKSVYGVSIIVGKGDAWMKKRNKEQRLTTQRRLRPDQRPVLGDLVTSIAKSPCLHLIYFDGLRELSGFVPAGV